MKNIHVIPTSSPSKIFYIAENFHLEKGQLIEPKSYHNVYITSDEEIKEDNWVYFPISNEVLKIGNGSFEASLETVKTNEDCKKIILTTDPDLIADGVQAIDDEFLEWFVNNPTCEFVEVIPPIFSQKYAELINYSCPKGYLDYKIIIPKEEPKQEYVKCTCANSLEYSNCGKKCERILDGQETLEEAYLNELIDEANKEFTLDRKLAKKVAIKYAKWQQEKMYSEENVFQFFERYREDFLIHRNIQVLPSQFKQWFEQFKK
jgi:hypothetical protein